MKKRNFDVVHTKAIALQKKAEELIIGTMNDLNIGVVSLVKNGDGSEYDVWKPYCVKDNSWDAPEYTEIIVIANVSDRVCIIPDGVNISMGVLDVMNEFELFPKNETEEGSELMKVLGDELMLVDETLTPTETFIDLSNTISEIRGLVNNKPITERTKLARD